MPGVLAGDKIACPATSSDTGYCCGKSWFGLNPPPGSWSNSAGCVTPLVVMSGSSIFSWMAIWLSLSWVNVSLSKGAVIDGRRSEDFMATS